MLKHFFCNKVIPSLLMLAAVTNTSHANEVSELNKNSIHKIITKEFQDNDLHGLICGISKGEESITFSMGESMTNYPATTEMHFRVGGVTINFLITVLLQLVEENTLLLDDPISLWFPQYQKSKDVTMRMLANCTSGYFDFIHAKAFNESFDKNVFKNWTTDELIELALKEPMLFEPGKGWAYSHTNFLIIGQILEKVTGKTVEALFSERIIHPLGLNNTTFPSTPQIPEPVFHAFTKERGLYEESTFWNPSWTSYSGLLLSTIGDMVKWTNAFGNGQLINHRLMQEMTAPTTVGLGNNKKEKYYGLGIGVMNGWLIQNPKFGGYNCFMAYSPSKDLSIFIVSTGSVDSPPNINFSQLITEKLIEQLFD